MVSAYRTALVEFAVTQFALTQFVHTDLATTESPCSKKNHGADGLSFFISRSNCSIRSVYSCE
jgi:hypothetical protein